MMGTTPEGDLLDILYDAGFIPSDEEPDTYDHGPVRLVYEGSVTVYRFSDPRTRVLEWSARFDSATPLRLIIAALRVAGAPIK
jgi:hypothetical protein